MSLIAAKIAITPTLMWAVSAASRRWGSLVGGLLSGCRSPRRRSRSTSPSSRARASPPSRDRLGGGARGGDALLTSPTPSAPRGWGGRLPLRRPVGFILGGLVLHGLIRPGLWLATAIDVPIMALVVALCPRAAGPAAPTRVRGRRAGTCRRAWLRRPRWCFWSRRSRPISLGPERLLAPIPIISWPLIAFARFQDGVRASLDVVRGSAQGAFGVLAFYVCIHLLLGRTDMVTAYAVSITCRRPACCRGCSFGRRIRAAG